MIDPKLILELGAAYKRGENIMSCARQHFGSEFNEVDATLVSYDLQAGSYVRRCIKNPEENSIWCMQLAELLLKHISDGDRIMEVGCGEATTLAGVIQLVRDREIEAFGFDISWSRCAKGIEWLASERVTARLFVADLFSIPMDDSSMEIIFSSHSLEPNGGREEEALAEILRVASKMVILVEPIYELASEEAKKRMSQNGYVRGLKEIAEKHGGEVIDYRLLPYTANSLNPSGVIIIRKKIPITIQTEKSGKKFWKCPYTYTNLEDHGDVFFPEIQD